MKLKIFDVVELNNGDKATILEITKSEYKVEVVDIKGISQGIKHIEDKDIKQIIFQNKSK